MKRGTYIRTAETKRKLSESIIRARGKKPNRILNIRCFGCLKIFHPTDKNNFYKKSAICPKCIKEAGELNKSKGRYKDE